MPYASRSDLTILVWAQRYRIAAARSTCLMDCAGSVRSTRYNAELTKRGLDELNLPMLKPQDLQRLDDVKHMDKLVRLGRAVGAAQVRPEHFARHIPP
jgi:hypothetical protein